MILFGSALDTRCRKESDIDIAVFGDKSRYTFLRSGEYRIFSDAVYGFGNMQEYDILYFQSGKEGKHDILEDIHRGVVIYQKGD
ncbi:MAG: hypothetical protein IJP92_13855 [Lachnospiraceae bacterium]|nr:hypothetical protein [Lachnospiraceae bacterium]